MHKHISLPIHPCLTHPLTGRPLQAVGVIAGRPVWPVLGGSAPAGVDAGAGAPADPGNQGAGDGAGAGKEWTPPASQEELDRIINRAVGRAHSHYGMTPEEAKGFKERVEALETELGSEADKAAKAARDEERARASGEFVPRVVRAEFKAAAKGVLDADQTKNLMEFLDEVDMSKYIDAKGEPDVEKIESRVNGFKGAAAAGGNASDPKTPPRPLGQGARPAASVKPGDQGRAMAEKRFNKS